MTPEVIAVLVGGLVTFVVGAVSGGLVARYTHDLQLQRDSERNAFERQLQEERNAFEERLQKSLNAFEEQLQEERMKQQAEKEAADKISNDLQVGVKSSAQIVAATKIQNAINANRRG